MSEREKLSDDAGQLSPFAAPDSWADRFTALHEFAAGFAGQTVEEIEREAAKALAEVRTEASALNRAAPGSLSSK